MGVADPVDLAVVCKREVALVMHLIDDANGLLAFGMLFFHQLQALLEVLNRLSLLLGFVLSLHLLNRFELLHLVLLLHFCLRATSLGTYFQ